MKKLFSVVVLTLSTSGLALAAAPECDLQADAAWLEQGEFQEKAESMGYTISDLVVSDGNCYQLTGQNKDGQDITAFFNPQTGDVVQEDIVQ